MHPATSLPLRLGCLPASTRAAASARGALCEASSVARAAEPPDSLFRRHTLLYSPPRITPLVIPSHPFRLVPSLACCSPLLLAATVLVVSLRPLLFPPPTLPVALPSAVLLPVAMPWGVRPSVLPRPATPATPLPLVPTLTLLTLAGGVAAVVSAAQERANYRRTRALLSHPPSSVGGGGGGGGGDGTLAPHPLATASSPASARLCGVGASSDARPDGWRGRRGGDTAAAAPKLLNTHVGGGGRVVSASPAGGVAEKKRGGGWKSIQWDVVSFSSSVLFSM